MVGVELIRRVPGEARVDERRQLDPHGYGKAIQGYLPDIPQQILIFERGDELVLAGKLLAQLIDLVATNAVRSTHEVVHVNRHIDPDVPALQTGEPVYHEGVLADRLVASDVQIGSPEVAG